METKNSTDSTKSDNVLRAKYEPPTRPYSKNELKDMEHNLRRRFKLSDKFVYHTKCNHFYLVKENSQKEKDILENNTNIDIGNCSICWKINNTSKDLRNTAKDMIYHYSKQFKNEPAILTYDLFDLENVYYQWLYI